jgi:hypothetical protein
MHANEMKSRLEIRFQTHGSWPTPPMICRLTVDNWGRGHVSEKERRTIREDGAAQLIELRMLRTIPFSRGEEP